MEHSKENLEVYIRHSEARLLVTASPWMKAEIRKGIELAKAELAQFPIEGVCVTEEELSEEYARLSPEEKALLKAIEQTHRTDSDCTLDPITQQCKVCGVLHGDPCLDCGGRGFHRSHCRQLRIEAGHVAN
jgi:hypothetical protein